MKLEYLNSLNTDTLDELDLEMMEYAKEHDVPIILNEGLMFLRFICDIKRPLNILEVGGAIGFSSINMAKYCKANIDTIEIDEKSYNEMVKNINKANLSSRIKPFLCDALEIDLSLLKDKYDIIFIDAAKGQYIKFFEKFSPLLNEDGIIVTDNIVFHDLIFEEHIHSRNLRGLIKRVKRFNEYLKNNNEYVTRVFNVGDGISISKKREK